VDYGVHVVEWYALSELGVVPANIGNILIHKQLLVWHPVTITRVNKPLATAWSWETSVESFQTFLHEWHHPQQEAATILSTTF
jgi:hypothetical protein